MGLRDYSLYDFIHHNAAAAGWERFGLAEPERALDGAGLGDVAAHDDGREPYLAVQVEGKKGDVGFWVSLGEVTLGGG